MSNDKLKNFQIQLRTRKKIVPCDRLSQTFFKTPPEKYAGILEQRYKGGCKEDKEGKIITPYWLKLVEGYADKLPPDAFTREVLFDAISAYEQGIRVITISTTLDSLTGGVEKRHVSKEQYEALRAAFDKLAFTRIEIDLAPSFKAYPNWRRNYSGELKLIGTLLPCRFLEGEINGQKTFAIELLAESPLMTVAKAKKQLITYDASPLAIAGQNNTPQVITVKNYLLRRIKLIIERGLNSSIEFKTLYENCGLANASDSVKRNARKEIVDILNSFKADGVIQNYEIKRLGRAYQSITITTNSPRRLRQNRA